MLLTTSSRNLDRGSASPPTPAASAFTGRRAHSTSAMARITPPTCIDGDVAIWRLIHGADWGTSEVNCLTSDDYAEFAQLNTNARCRARATRTFLRKALSAAVDDEIHPHAWRFVRSAFGKPYVASGLPVVHFSTTHTRGVSLIATSRNSCVGLDGEALGIRGWHTIADGMFTRRERAIVNSVPPCAREQTFLRIWTAREAYAKLIGTGLAFDVSANDCGPGTHLATWSDEGPSARVVLTLAVNQSAKGNGNGERGQ
jgi:phosphopantetheinyl transferase